MVSATTGDCEVSPENTPTCSAGELPPDQPVDPHKILIIMI